MKQIIVIILLILCSVRQLEAQQNPFLNTDDNPQTTEKQIDRAVLTRTGFFYNSPMMQKIKSIQKKIQTRISGYISEYKNNKGNKTLITFLLSSFIYGLLHVLGPGHRKIFLFSYFVSKPSRWKQGMLAGFLSAVLHAVSAMLLIGGLYLITTKALMTRFNNLTPLLERISYGSIAVIGIYLLIYHIAEYIKHNDHSHNIQKRNPDTIIFIIASGLIPCPGAATIMLFSLAAGAPFLGIYSVAAMSLGMAVVLSLIPPAAILIQSRLEPLITRWNPKTGKMIHLVISAAGAIFLVILGILFII